MMTNEKATRRKKRGRITTKAVKTPIVENKEIKQGMVSSLLPPLQKIDSAPPTDYSVWKKNDWGMIKEEMEAITLQQEELKKHEENLKAERMLKFFSYSVIGLFVIAVSVLLMKMFK